MEEKERKWARGMKYELYVAVNPAARKWATGSEAIERAQSKYCV
jgi:hypothetical protein